MCLPFHLLSPCFGTVLFTVATEGKAVELHQSAESDIPEERYEETGDWNIP